MPDSITYSLVLPAYQEEDNLRILLPRIKTVFDNLQCSYEVIVIDTVTPLDKTREVVLEYGASYFNRKPANFFGDAVRTGINVARGDWIIFMDADGSHAPEFIPNLLKEIPLNDVVIASRYIRGGNTENSWILILMSRIVNLSYSLILNLKCKDVSNSFKVYRASLLQNLQLTCNNFDIIEEILFKINRKYPKVRFKEVSFQFGKRRFGKTKRNLVVFALTFLATLIKLRFSKIN